MASPKENNNGVNYDFKINATITDVNSNPNVYTKKPKGFGKRHIQVILGCLAMTILLSLRTNMSLSIVAMTTHSYTHYEWNEGERGLVLSSNSWGFALSPIVGGIVAKKYGPKWPLLLSVLLSCSLTMCTPFVSQFGWELVCILRFLQGSTQGFITPSVHTLMSNWLPPSERGFITLTFAGAMTGILLTMGMSGILVASPFGWPAVFYYTGLTGYIWAIFFSIFGTNTPNEYKTITLEEETFIHSLSNKHKSTEKLPIPWKAISCSKPFWAFVFGQMVHNWGLYTLMSYIPSYIDGILRLDIETNGLFSTLPYILMVILILISSSSSNYILKHDIMTLGHLRKLCNTFGMWIPGICFIILASINNDLYSALILMTLGIGFTGFTFAGCLVNHCDFAPNFAGPLIGICLTLGSSFSIAGPLFVGFIVSDVEDASLWAIAFATTAALYFVGGLIFLVYGSAEVQNWNNEEKK